MEKQNSITSCCVGLNKCNCIHILNESEKEYLLANSALVNYKKQETIIKNGCLVSNILYVEKGLIKVFIENESNVLVLKIVTEGNLLGLTSINEKINTYQYSAIAYVDSVIRHIDINAFRNLIKQNPVFAKEIIDLLNTNTVQLNNRFFCLSHKQAFGRIADILLCLAERVFMSYEFELPLNRKELADLTALTPETVIRLLKQLSSEKIITFSAKKIHILEPQALKIISEKG